MKAKQKPWTMIKIDGTVFSIALFGFNLPLLTLLVSLTCMNIFRHVPKNPVICRS